MIVIPTIEVQGGRCAQPARGEYAQPTVYARDPALLARTFMDEGAPRLHVVDLDAARGMPTSESASAAAGVVDVCVAASCEVQVGGGVRALLREPRECSWGGPCMRVGSTLQVPSGPSSALPNAPTRPTYTRLSFM
jgi:phosphoribosylformimino-5-aminoimidazole carboxamide ribonucleotide (ProFAR) isomerase